MKNTSQLSRRLTQNSETCLGIPAAPVSFQKTSSSARSTTMGAALTGRDFALIDDFLTYALIDQVYYWAKIRKVLRNKPLRGVPTHQITDLIVNGLLGVPEADSDTSSDHSDSNSDSDSHSSTDSDSDPPPKRRRGRPPLHPRPQRPQRSQRPRPHQRHQRTSRSSRSSRTSDSVPQRLTHCTNKFLSFPAVESFLKRFRHPALKSQFIKHTKRYLQIYLPDCGFDVQTTDRYRYTKPGRDRSADLRFPELKAGREDEYAEGSTEACIVARRPFRTNEEIRYCTGLLVGLTSEELEDLNKGKDFSIIKTSRRGGLDCLMLGPARLVNHDCRANARFVSHGLHMELRALRPILCGEEITVRYAENYFGRRNCECLCASCESSRSGAYGDGDSKESGVNGGNGENGRNGVEKPNCRTNSRSNSSVPDSDGVDSDSEADDEMDRLEKVLRAAKERNRRQRGPQRGPQKRGIRSERLTEQRNYLPLSPEASGSHSGTDVEVEAEAEAKVEAQADAGADANAETDAEAEADAEREADADAEAEAQAEAEADVEADSVLSDNSVSLIEPHKRESTEEPAFAHIPLPKPTPELPSVLSSELPSEPASESPEPQINTPGPLPTPDSDAEAPRRILRRRTTRPAEIRAAPPPTDAAAAFLRAHVDSADREPLAAELLRRELPLDAATKPLEPLIGSSVPVLELFKVFSGREELSERELVVRKCFRLLSASRCVRLTRSECAVDSVAAEAVLRQTYDCVNCGILFRCQSEDGTGFKFCPNCVRHFRLYKRLWPVVGSVTARHGGRADGWADGWRDSGSESESEPEVEEVDFSPCFRRSMWQLLQEQRGKPVWVPPRPRLQVINPKQPPVVLENARIGSVVPAGKARRRGRPRKTEKVEQRMIVVKPTVGNIALRPRRVVME